MKNNDVWRVEKLTSGFWSIWCGSEWLDASQKTKEDAEKLMQKLKSK